MISSNLKSEKMLEKLNDKDKEQIAKFDLYKEAKEYPSTGTATLLQNMTFNKIFEK